MSADAIQILAANFLQLANGEPNPLAVLLLVLFVCVVGYGVLFALIWSHSP